MMEQLAPGLYNPLLKSVLKSYQTAAVRSLSGPSSYAATWAGHPGPGGKLSPAELEQYSKALMIDMNAALKKSQADPKLVEVGPLFGGTPFPLQHITQIPILIPMDNTKSEKSETMLEGVTIACFIVGGEKRLCLPQILNTVLREFCLQEINVVCDELHIFCSRCNPEQLEILKVTGTLPSSAPSCGLITKTDAERLCNALLHRAPEKATDAPTPNAFKVYHECFGKCKGIFNPELYDNPHAKCIECCDCHGMFSPQKFVCHSHKALENRTCHWGFDSANWRSYLLLAKDQEQKGIIQKVLEDMKGLYDFMSRYKRKEHSPSPHKEGSGEKKPRYDENAPPKSEDMPAWFEGGYKNNPSAFQPWSSGLLNSLKDGKLAQAAQFGRESGKGVPANLQSGPPILLNPERVVRHSESDRYDHAFAPNVSLAPQPVKKKEGEESDCVIKSESTRLPDPMPCTPSPMKEDAPFEVDVSSDTEDSSLKSDSVPSTPCESRSLLQSPVSDAPSAEHEKLTAMLRDALEGKVGDTEQAKENFVQQVMKMFSQQEKQNRSLTQSRRELQQELEFLRMTKKEKLREASEAKRGLRKELSRLRSENEIKTKDAAEERQHLKKELEVLKSSKNPEIARRSG